MNSDTLVAVIAYQTESQLRWPQTIPRRLFPFVV